MIHTDAALQKKKNRSEWGITAGNHEGKLQVTWAGPEERCCDHTVEEALAIRLALVKARKELENGVLSIRLQKPK